MRKIIVGILIMMLIGYIIPQTTMAMSNELQTLIDETPTGEKLQLTGKTYEGNVVITKPITITGEKGTVIQGDHTDNVIEIDSDDVTIENLAVTGSGKSRDSEQEHSGVRVMGDSIILKNLEITDSFHGVLLNRIDHTTIEGLSIFGASSESLSEQGNGIHILRSNDSLITDSYIEEFRDGIYVEYSDNNQMNNNTMTKTRYGLHYMYSDFNSFHDNEFIRNVGGAAIMHSDFISLEDNEFSFNQGSRSFGLLIQSSREIQVLTNEFHLNQRGLLFEHSTANKITGNDFFHNQIGVELWSSATANVFAKNTFTKNTNNVLTVGGPSNNQWFDSSGNGNYWNEPMIDLNEDGVGDIPYEDTSSLGQLIEKNELAYLFLESPAIDVYEKTNSILGNQEVMAVDDYPFITERAHNKYLIYISVGILIIGFTYIYSRKRRKNSNHE